MKPQPYTKFMFTTNFFLGAICFVNINNIEEDNENLKDTI